MYFVIQQLQPELCMSEWIVLLWVPGRQDVLCGHIHATAVPPHIVWPKSNTSALIMITSEHDGCHEVPIDEGTWSSYVDVA